jgi:hypothetical protein
MFDRSKGALFGAAVLSGLTASMGAPAASAGARQSPAPAPGPNPDRHCAMRALPVDAIARGETSPVVCAATRDEAIAALDGTSGGAFLAAAAFASAGYNDFRLGWMYDDPNGPAGSGMDLEIWGPACDGYGVDMSGGWDNRISAHELKGCSNSKLYTGHGYTGASTAAHCCGVLGLQPGFNDNVRSVKFGH